MATYRLWKHKDYDRSVRHLPPSIQQKALWAQVLLGTRGRTPSVKGTTGFDLRWRRTPVQGNHFYMWWIPQSESGLQNGTVVSKNGSEGGQSILIHSVRHHDATSDPIAPGYLDDYQEIHVADLDPRFAEQRMVARQLDGLSIDLPRQQRPISLATVKGLPGSGKTISLLYLVRDLLHRTDQGNILYITYTARLKRAAEEFLLAQDPSFAQRVQLKTLNEVQSEFTGITSPPESFRALDDFCKFLDVQNTSTLGPWRRYPQALYTEIRAHLLGRDFPPNFELLGQKVGEKSTRLEPLDARSYAKMRKLDIESAEIAQKVSIRAAASRFFREQKAAQRALEILLSGKMPPWLANISGVLVDEVQDLTLLQIALLGEMVKTAVDVQGRQNNGTRFANTPFVFTVAGDESQIVQPTGFDWGVTKDLLAKQLVVHPTEYEFQHQRRSPRVLANLVESSWNFYGFLPKSHRPSARRDAFVDESVAADHQYEDGGRVLLCGDLQPTSASNRSAANMRNRSGIDPTSSYVEATKNADWFSLFEEMVDKPGRILIDLTEQLRSVLSESTRAVSDEVLFLPREIKGLERSNVVIYGLNALYEQAMLLCDDDNEDNIPRFEARRLFDEVRVALSRSTNTLVLLEPPDAPVLTHLEIDAAALASPDIQTISWGDLIDILRTEEMSEIEAIQRYLDEVEDLIERERWGQAYQRNRRAHALAAEITDLAFQREADSQHVKIHLQEAAGLFAREDWSAAYERNRAAHRLALAVGDPLVLDQIDDQVQQFRSTLSQQARIQLEQAQNWLESGGYKIALRDTKTALDLAEAIQDEPLVDEIRQTTISVCTNWSYQLTGDAATETDLAQARALLVDAIKLLQQANRPESAAWQMIADRYEVVPQIGQLSATQLPQVLAHAKEWEQLVQTQLSESGPVGIQFVLRWLNEAYNDLGEQLVLYYEWAASAEAVLDLVTEMASQSSADSTPNMAMNDTALDTVIFDEYLLDLEHRVGVALEENPERTKRTQRGLDHFSAFMLGYNGDAAEAALEWEKLGNLPEAARQARKAGQLEYAYDLLRTAKAPIPEEVSISVKALRLLQQLAAKHDGLNPAEKKTLSAKMIEIQSQLGAQDSSDYGNDDGGEAEDVWTFVEDGDS